jgi:hypothetical protein
MHEPGDAVLPAAAADSREEADVYGSNIQTAELNSLNAMLAVVCWKRRLGYYSGLSGGPELTFSLYTNEIDNGYST